MEADHALTRTVPPCRYYARLRDTTLGSSVHIDSAHATPSPSGNTGIPLHITQRGVNRCAIFLDDDDRRHYLGLLGDSAAKHGLGIHAYVLMGNHVHLLVSSDESGRVSLAMRQLGQAYVTAFNRRHRRTGPL